MKRFNLYLCSFAALLLCYLFMQGCHGRWDGPNPGSATSAIITISGQVTDQAGGQPLGNASVKITSPSSLARAAATDSTGDFHFKLTSESSVTLSIQASKEGYKTQSFTLDAAPGADTTHINITLARSGETDSTGTNGGSETDKGAALILLANMPKSAINIKATGGNVSAPVTFQVQDSLGRPLNAQNTVTAHFKLISQPGGADLAPHQAATNAQGKVTTTLLSGNHAGPVKVQVSIERPKYGLTIYSKPVVIAIHGGYPDKNHFSITPDKHNFEGYDINNNRNEITVVLGDKYSNPVMPGTIVYFKTTEGIIEGSAATDEDGVAAVELISGDPRSADGSGVVTAITVNADDQRIQKTTDLILSTSHADIKASPDNFTIPNEGSQSFNYTITDLNDNPMPAGTQIKVDAGKGLKLTGDVDFTLGDYTDSGKNTTKFSFSAVDADGKANIDADVTIKITVETPSGTVTTYSDLQGMRH
jgi:hypothetical protein